MFLLVKVELIDIFEAALQKCKRVPRRFIVSALSNLVRLL